VQRQCAGVEFAKTLPAVALPPHSLAARSVDADMCRDQAAAPVTDAVALLARDGPVRSREEVTHAEPQRLNDVRRLAPSVTLDQHAAVGPFADSERRVIVVVPWTFRGERLPVVPRLASARFELAHDALQRRRHRVRADHLGTTRRGAPLSAERTVRTRAASARTSVGRVWSSPEATSAAAAASATSLSATARASSGSEVAPTNMGSTPSSSRNLRTTSGPSTWAPLGFRGPDHPGRYSFT